MEMKPTIQKHLAPYLLAAVLVLMFADFVI
jgi:hypothetical protein